MQQSSTANFWSGLAVVAQRRSIWLSVLGAVCSGISVIFIALGGPLENLTDRRQITVGILAIVAFVGLSVLREWGQSRMSRTQVTAAAQYRTAVKDALRPVAGQIAEMQGMTPKKREAQLEKVATQVVGSMQLLLNEVDGLRAVVYKLTDPDHLEKIASLGREQDPARNFERHPGGRPDVAFDALSENRSQLVPDVRRANQAGRGGHGTDHGYLTYIAVPIVVGDRGYGMLTLDASLADSFTDTDLKVCEFVAGLLGIAFACAQTS